MWKSVFVISIFPPPASFAASVHAAVCRCNSCHRCSYSAVLEWLRWYKNESASELLPRVHLIASLLKRWMLGTHQGAVSHEHLEFYLDEFTFRFNRRRSKNRGKLFYRMVQQAVVIDPVPYKSMILCDKDGAIRHHNL